MGSITVGQKPLIDDEVEGDELETLITRAGETVPKHVLNFMI